MLSSKLLLTHYNPKLPIVVAADASTHGLGAVLLHIFPDASEKAVMHASRTLTPAERRYGQIEKEASALIFAVRRFHKFIYGRRFTLLRDHKQLLSIFGSNKGIPAHSANRLQCWALVLLRYNFDIQYRRSEDFGKADALSRLISNHSTTDEDRSHSHNINGRWLQCYTISECCSSAACHCWRCPQSYQGRPEYSRSDHLCSEPMAS